MSVEPGVTELQDDFGEVRDIAKSLHIPDETINEIIGRLEASFITMAIIRDVRYLDLRYLLGEAHIPPVIILRLEQRYRAPREHQTVSSQDLTASLTSSTSSSPPSTPSQERKSPKKVRGKKYVFHRLLLSSFPLTFAYSTHHNYHSLLGEKEQERQANLESY
jgi:hypothetical protein